MNADFGPIALATRFQAAGVDPGWTSCAMGLIRYGLREGDEVMPPIEVRPYFSWIALKRLAV